MCHGLFHNRNRRCGLPIHFRLGFLRVPRHAWEKSQEGDCDQCDDKDNCKQHKIFGGTLRPQGACSRSELRFNRPLSVQALFLQSKKGRNCLVRQTIAGAISCSAEQLCCSLRAHGTLDGRAIFQAGFRIIHSASSDYRAKARKVAEKARGARAYAVRAFHLACPFRREGGKNAAHCGGCVAFGLEHFP